MMLQDGCLLEFLDNTKDPFCKDFVSCLRSKGLLS